MRVEPRPHEIRRLVIERFRGFGATGPILFDLEEKSVVNRGRYVGRTYRVDGLMAMWLAEVGIVQFYDADGHMLATVNVFERVPPRRMAAWANHADA